MFPRVYLLFVFQSIPYTGLNSHLAKSSRRLETSNNVKSNATVQFPSNNPEVLNNANSTSKETIEPRRKSDSLPIHPHPLKLEIKSIVKNSTKADAFELDPLFAGEGRGLPDIDYLSWLIGFFTRGLTSYALVAVMNFLLAPFLKKFGWNGPSWETSISFGNNGKNILNQGPNLKKLKIDFGGKGKNAKKEDHSKEEGWGWGQGGGGGPGYPSQFQGHPGGLGGLQSAGWMSYDQYALALPMVDKYSQKAAKKSQKFAKKAQKYAMKAHKYAAKAQAYRLQVRPAAYGQLPGLPGHGGIGIGGGGYGWGG
jgi:hypothetical protein